MFVTSIHNGDYVMVQGVCIYVSSMLEKIKDNILLFRLFSKC